MPMTSLYTVGVSQSLYHDSNEPKNINMNAVNVVLSNHSAKSVSK